MVQIIDIGNESYMFILELAEKGIDSFNEVIEKYPTVKKLWFDIERRKENENKR